MQLESCDQACAIENSGWQNGKDAAEANCQLLFALLAEIGQKLPVFLAQRPPFQQVWTIPLVFSSALLRRHLRICSWLPPISNSGNRHPAKFRRPGVIRIIQQH
jgi:hypothetical protein